MHKTFHAAQSLSIIARDDFGNDAMFRSDLAVYVVIKIGRGKDLLQCPSCQRSVPTSQMLSICLAKSLWCGGPMRESGCA